MHGTPPALATLPYMTPWYGPKALAQTGLKAVTSQLILSQIDQRILQAAIDVVDKQDVVKRYDYSDPVTIGLAPGQPVWVDYVADTGDGFDATYAIASLLATPHLSVDGVADPLPAGRLLVMGGDQAYPFASDAEYARRCLAAYDLTTWHQPEESAPGARKLFVLPGNHDWYDGLASFDRVFCTRRDGISPGRNIGAWQCQQHRSYWAIKLPYDWWIWGLDVQLNQSLDIGQIQYFNLIAQSIQKSLSEARKTNPSAAEPKILICIPTPSWYTGDETGDVRAYSANLLKILNLAIDSGKVSAVFTGDSHHYSRYFSSDHRLNLFTAGGGGAYTAPTHALPEKLLVPWKTSSETDPIVLPFTLTSAASTDDDAVADKAGKRRAPSAYPSARTSRWLSWRILLFPIYNPTFCMALASLYVLLWWFYSASQATMTTALAEVLNSEEFRRIPQSGCLGGALKDTVAIPCLIGLGKWLGLWEQLRLPFTAARHGFEFAGAAALVFGLIWALFAGARGTVTRLLETILFGACHIYSVTALAQIMQSFGGKWLPQWASQDWPFLIYALAMWGMGFAVAGLLCGVYLFLGNRLFMTHVDRGFSAIRLTSHKNFLRLKLTPDELTIYPIGLDSVPSRWNWRAATALEHLAGVVAAYVPARPLKPRLIEGPIVIRPAEIVSLVGAQKPSGRPGRS